MELCQEGEAPECLWLLESGTVFAVDISCRPRHTVFAPAMFGDAMLVASQVPACRDRLYGYRTDTPCRMWRLSLRDMTSAQRVCPAIRIAYLAYLQVKLLQLLSGFPSDEQFCEVVARIMAVLEGADAEAREEVLEELQQVRACAPWDCMMHDPHITRRNANDNQCLPEWPCPLPLPAPSPSSLANSASLAGKAQRQQSPVAPGCASGAELSRRGRGLRCAGRHWKDDL